MSDPLSPFDRVAWDGFIHAVMLLDSLDVKIDLDAVEAQLREVADGNLSLLDAPEDQIRRAKNKFGQISEALRATTYENEQYRRDFDTKQRLVASAILRQMGKLFPV